MPGADDNTYPDCKRCGSCCEVNALCMTEADFRRIVSYISEHDITPIDYGKTRCCFQNTDNTCMIWEARAQVCRLHNCTVSRHDILEADPSLKVDEDLWLVDMHEAFVNNAMGDEISNWGSWSADGQTPAYLAATRMASLSNRNVETILGCLSLKPGMSVLDVGCGSGEYCFRLGMQLSDVSFTGLDFDEGFVRFATMRANGSIGYPYETPDPRNDYQFICGDGANMPFGNNAFDAVVSHTFLTAILDWKKSLSEMKRVCKPGGVVSSVTSMTDDFYGTGTIRLFADSQTTMSAGLIARIDAVSARAFPEVELTGGIAPSDVPRAFAEAGFQQITCQPLGHYFCLSDASLGNREYRRYVDLLRLVEEERLVRLLSNPAAKSQLPEKDWERFAELIERRYTELISSAGANDEWNWYGNASLLVCGIA